MTLAIAMARRGEDDIRITNAQVCEQIRELRRMREVAEMTEVMLASMLRSRGMTLDELAEELDTSRQALSKLHRRWWARLGPDSPDDTPPNGNRRS